MICWGWTSTSIFSGGIANRYDASITSRPLFIMVAESTEILAPIAKLGWATASAGVARAMASLLAPRNGPPEDVRIKRRT